MKRLRRWVLASTLLLLGAYACALRTFPPKVTVRLQWDPHPAAHRIGGPSDVQNMDCMLVLATGSGIGSSVSSGDVGDRLPSCLGFGTHAPFVSLTTLTAPDGGADLSLPAGAGRVITVLGVTANQAGGCTGKTAVRDFFTGGTPSFYVVGRSAPTDLFQSGTIVVNNSYSQAAAEDLVGTCQPQGSGGSLTLTATKAYVGDSGNPTAAVDFTDTLTLSLPPLNYSGTQMFEIPVSSPPSNTFTLSPAVGALHARIDVLYDLTGIDLSQYSTVTVQATAAGGTTPFSGTCLSVPFSSSDDLWELGVYDNGAWSTAVPSLNAATLTVAANSPPVSTTEAGTPYLHVSMRSNDYSGPNCAALQFGSLSARLNP